MKDDDSRITAYALGELSEGERDAFEKELAESPETRETIREIRATADLLREGFGFECEGRGLTGAQRATVLAGGDAAGGPAAGKVVEVSFWSRARRHVLWAGSAAAAVVCVLFVVRQEESMELDSRRAPELHGGRAAEPGEAEVAADLDGMLEENLVPGREMARPGSGEKADDAPGKAEMEKTEVEMTVTVARDEIESGSRAKGGKRPAKISTIPALQEGVELPKQVMPATALADEGAAGSLDAKKSAEPKNNAIAGASGNAVGGAGGWAKEGPRPTSAAAPAPKSARSLARDPRPAPDTVRAAASAATAPRPAGPEPVAAAGQMVDRQAVAGVRSGTASIDSLSGDDLASTAVAPQALNGPIVDSPFRDPAIHALSTFSVDVDGAAYANVRRMIEAGRRPPRDAVRIEEMINYFDYDYEMPGGEHAIVVDMEVAACPWNPAHRLVRIGLNGREHGIESVTEPRNVLGDDSGDSGHTIAEEVKVQIEFNPGEVSAYRLIGFANRRVMVSRDVTDDASDAGELNAGRPVTALFEVVPVGVGAAAGRGEIVSRDRRVGAQTGRAEEAPGREWNDSDDMVAARIRYRVPGDVGGNAGRLLEVTLRDAGASWEEASEDFRFAAAVGAFGMLLRDSEFLGTASLEGILGWLAGLEGESEDRRDFEELLRKSRKVLRARQR